MKRFYLMMTAAVVALSASATDVYLRGSWHNNWQADDGNKFTTVDDNVYHLDNVTIKASDEWKIGSATWQEVDFGGATNINAGETVKLQPVGSNCTLADDYTGEVNFNLSLQEIVFGAAPESWSLPPQLYSGTLPVLYINIYNTDDEGNFTTLNDEVLSKDLGDKNYRPGNYWLDVTPCAWAVEAGYESVGSAEDPLPLEMKARGNFTRTAFAKKPFKLKLGKKQTFLGMTPEKSKHWAILAHADDVYGYLRNFTGFNLGKRIGLPWTPWQQPVEVIMNGDYRGIYFLTESIRVGDGRVPVQDLGDNVSDPVLASGGYLVELDNYDEENQTRMEEASCAPDQWCDMLRVTWDTPEEYSDLQQRFITEQFSAMNDAVGRCDRSDDLWKYMDLDDAARYYVVEEIMSHVESYHGSTYLFRDRGADRKWHFSPLWDFGNGFNGYTDQYFFNCDPYGNTWIPSMVRNAKFMDKVRETWKWFMANKYDGVIADIDEYVSQITEAAKYDRNRWKDAPQPEGSGMGIVNNTNMTDRRNAAVEKLTAKIEWLRQQWGDYSGTYSEPERDTTEAAPLPDYLSDPLGAINGIFDAPADAPAIYYDLQGNRVLNPAKGSPVIVRRGSKATKEIF